ncbi:MAG TPA: MarR family transcriptional regulator [Telluria sp.]|nr:MarR family transcriptional regulator [Telluria sp.]
MSIFESTSKRLQNLKARIPDFPLEKMRLVRLTYHVQKNMRDLTNAALKQHDLVDASYLVLTVLYGSEDETSSASALGVACNEKPANLTRLCNDLEARCPSRFRSGPRIRLAGRRLARLGRGRRRTLDIRGQGHGRRLSRAVAGLPPGTRLAGDRQ